VVVPALSFVRYWQLPATELNAGWLPAVSAPVIAATPGVYVQESGTLAGVLSLLWLLGVAVMLLRHFGGLRIVGALERNPFESLPTEWQQRLLALQNAMGVSRKVAVRLAAEIASPFTARLFRPVIWLPLSLLTRLPVDQVEALLAHELAHIQRLDWLWNGLQCVLESLLFFHPGAWWLSRRIRQEREHACDDLAVAACGNAIALAEALAELELDRHHFPRLVLAADGGSLMKRITRLLAGSSTGSRWRLPAGIAVLVISGGLLATQSGVIRNSLPGIHIESSTDGTLGPGDEREIRTTGLDGERYYIASVDRNGKLTELYKKDGKVQPITASVRTWIDEMSRLSVPPPPPPLPPPPPAPPAPPAAPAPPPPPKLSESGAFKEILRLVAADKSVTTALGTPITVVSNSAHGDITTSMWKDGDGEASLRFDLGGPKGQGTALVDAERADGVWKISSLELRPGGR